MYNGEQWLSKELFCEDCAITFLKNMRAWNFPSSQYSGLKNRSTLKTWIDLRQGEWISSRYLMCKPRAHLSNLTHSPIERWRSTNNEDWFERRLASERSPEALVEASLQRTKGVPPCDSGADRPRPGNYWGLKTRTANCGSDGVASTLCMPSL